MESYVFFSILVVVWLAFQKITHLLFPEELKKIYRSQFIETEHNVYDLANVESVKKIGTLIELEMRHGKNVRLETGNQLIEFMAVWMDVRSKRGKKD